MRNLLISFILILFNFSNTVFSQCNPIITPTTGSICTGSSISLTASGASSYSWSPSTGLNNTNAATVTANPTVTTTYTITGTCNNPTETGTKTITITVNSKPTLPTITVNNDNSCAGSTVSFSTPSQSGVTFSWNFGDGSALGNGATTTHIYSPNFGNNSTSYSVTLTATNSSGCTITSIQTVTVKQKPDAAIDDFSWVAPNSAFTNCGSGIYELTIDNISKTKTTNKLYQINWGDGNTPYQNVDLPETGTTHNYNTQGYFTLVSTVTGQNDCVSNRSYTIYNGSNPSVSFPNPGSTTGHCVPYTLTIPINNTSGNPPGTVYIISTNDGMAPITFNHPPPSSFTHTFTTTSCGASPNGSGVPNSYFINCSAENPCGKSPQPVWPITTSTKPEANFVITPDTIVCINSIVSFTNNSIGGVLVDPFGKCDTLTKRNWEISPSTGWGPPSGSNNELGSSNNKLGKSNPTNNSQSWGSNKLNVSFNLPGKYKIALIVRNSCGNDTISKTICVQAPPTPSFTASTLTGCTPQKINFTNTSTGLPTCGTITRLWKVSKTGSTCDADSTSDYAFVSGTNSGSDNPIIRFKNQGTYSITLSLTNVCGTFTSTAKIITIKRKPQVSITIPQNICIGQTISPTATVINCADNPLTYLWTFGGGTPSSSSLSIPPTIAFSSTGSHQVSLSVTNECGTTVKDTTINVLTIPTSNAGIDKTICSGSNVQIGNTTVSGLTYSWTPSTGLSNPLISNPIVNLSNTGNNPITQTYTLTVSNISNCSSVDNVIITVNPLPTISSTSQTICSGQSASITVSGADTYLWSTNSTSNPLTISPLVTTDYTVTGTSTLTGCTNTASGKITVNPLPVVNAGPSISLCNQPIANTLTGFSPASGGTWSGTGVSPSGVFTPSTTGNFILTYSYTNSANSCVNSDTMIVKVISPEIANAGTGFTKCLNTPDVTLSGFYPVSGGTWSGTGVTGNIFKPSTVGSYNLTYTFGSGTCISSDTIHIKVNSLPTISSTSQTICSGQSATLTASGGDTYLWSTNSTSNPISISPSITTDYTVTGTSTLTGCTNTATGKVTVNPIPVVNAGPSISLCNQPIAKTLTGFSPASGGTWSGTGVSASGVFTPSTNGNFILTYSYTNPANSCINSDTMKVTVVTPEIADAGTGFTKCLNTSDVTLTGFYPASGGTWSGTGVTGNIFKPSTIGSYNLTYTYGSGTCLSSDTIHVKVNALPVLSSTSQTICSGQSASLTAAGADTYLWSTNSTSNPLPISPLVTTDYTVTGTSTLTGCTNTAIGKVTVNPLPVVNAGPSISLCNQPIANTLTGFSPTTGGTWSGTGVSSSGVFTPSTNGNFVLTYSYTNPANSCINSDTMKVTVVSPEIADAGTGFTKCLNSPDVILTGFYPASGGTWTGTGVTGTIFTPSTVGDYFLTYSYGEGTCLSTDTIQIKINPLPLISSTSQTICIGQSASILASGGDTYLWSTNSTANPLSISPLITTDYTVTGTSTLTGCTNSAIGKVTVNPLPLVNAGPSITLCNQPIANTLTDFTPSSGGIWSGTGVSTSGVFTPSTNGNFILTYSYTNPINSCFNSDSMIVTVVTPEIASAGNDQVICLNNGELTLTNFSPTMGVWSGLGISNSTGIFNPLNSGVGDFEITLSYGSGTCFTQDKKNITVLPLPSISAGNDKTFCSTDPISNFIGSPLNGVWSVNGIINISTGKFDPNIAGTGTHTIVYCVTDPITLCKNYDSLTVKVNPLPIPSFSFNAIACKNVAHLFNSTSFLGTNPLWIFDDLSTSSDINTSHIFQNTGTFPVKLIETSMFGCRDSITQFVEVREAPNAIFTVSSDSICGPATISISNTSTGLFNSYAWNFGNSTSSTSTNPPPVLYQQGVIKDTTYIIKLDVSNLCGVSSQSIPIKIMPKPKSIFGTNLDYGCSPLHLNITNNSLGLPDNTYWNYGDGTTSLNSSQNTTHVFTTGTRDTTYLIQLIETNECGTDTSEYTILVHPNTVNAFFNTNYTSGCSPLTVDFTNFSTNNVFNNWDFGDGNNSTLLNTTHTFNQGNHKVALYVNNGCSYDTAYVNINVFPLQLVNFSYAPDSVCINKPFQFTNLSNGLASSTWDFGDGNSSILTNPTHSYTSSGSYTVKLTGISATNGCSAEISHTIKIKSTPVSNFLTSLINGCIPLPVNFTNSSINSNFQYWNFGDGNTSNLNSPIHTYQTAGNYTIKQVSINLNGCRDSITHSIIAHPLPISNFTINVSDVCTSPLIVNTTNTSTNAVNYTWDFNNGSVLSNLNNPIGSYSVPGDYTISLVSENIFQCKDTSEIKLKVSPILDVTYNIPDNINCRKEVLLFNSSVNFGDSVVWNFGNGEKKTGNPVWYIYPQSGQFDVSVVAYGNNGCTDTSAISQITVLPSPVADFESYNIKIDNKPSGTIQFTNHSLLANSYNWDFGDDFSSKDIDPIHKYLHNSNSTVTLYAINNYGCKDTISKLIEVDFFYGLFIPATMYPGHEVFGVANFVPIGVGIKEFEILVYDSWGNLVWKSTALDADGRPSEHWNGLFDGNVNSNGNGSGSPVQQDAYVWKASATFIDGSIWQGCPNVKGNISTSGSLTVIR